MPNKIESEQLSNDSKELHHRHLSKRSPNWSEEEIQALCAFVKEHKEKLFGLGEKANRKGVNAAKKQHWELAATLINERCSTQRHWSQVRKKWKDLAYRYLCARNPHTKKLQSKAPCQAMMELAEDETIQLNDVISSSESNSSSESATSCVTSGFNELCFSDVSVKAEVLDEEQQVPSSPTVFIVQGQSSSASRKADNSQLIESKVSHCCSAKAENNEKLNEKLNSLLEDILTKQLRSGTSVLTSGMSSYEKARLELERDKIALQKKTAKCLRNISKDIRQIRASICIRNRHKTRGNARKRQKWRSESDSSV